MLKEKYGFIYIWYDCKRKMYYIGSHWGTVEDGYICSSNRMRDAYRRRPQDFKRRIIQRHISRDMLLEEEYKWLQLIDDNELGKKYYNLRKHQWGHWSTDNTNKLNTTEKIKATLSDPEIKRKLSESKMGDKNPMKNPEVVRKRTETYKNGNHVVWNKGKKLGPNPEHSNRMKGRTPPNKGSSLSKETKEKLSKQWLIIKPDGSQEVITNLNEYCKQLNIISGNMRKVADGERNHCSGYICKRIE